MVVEVSTRFVHGRPVVLAIVATCMMVLEGARTLTHEAGPTRRKAEVHRLVER